MGRFEVNCLPGDNDKFYAIASLSNEDTDFSIYGTIGANGVVFIETKKGGI
jgi:hypothetical protein